MRWVNSPWVFPCSFIVLNIWWLAHDFHSHASVTRLDVYNIATVAAAIFFDVFWMSLNGLRQQVRTLDTLAVTAFRRIREGTDKLRESVEGGLVPKSELEKLRGELENLRTEFEKLRKKKR
jgi:hypothetical protein